MSSHKPDAIKGPYILKVNGVELVTEHQSLTAGAILILALAHEAISGKPEEYLLEGDKGTHGPGDVIDLLEENVFFAIPNRSTPVASFPPVTRRASSHVG